MKTFFRVFNDGYDHLSFKHGKCKIKNNIDQLPIKIGFPDGYHMGLIKREIRVTIEVTLNKPFTFTKELGFFTPDKKDYSIFISGTFDNCLFTSTPFILTHPPE